jgi:transcriptional regulator with XRE-family HTH domain
MTTFEKGEEYRRRRLNQGLSQGDAAKKAKINRSKLCLFERGAIQLTEKELKRLENVYGDKKYGRFYGRLGQLLDPDKPRSEPHRRKLRRQWADVSQTQLAKLTGISQTRISRWEAGSGSLTPQEEDLVRTTLDEAVERASINDPYRVALARDEDAEFLFNKLKEAERILRFHQTQLARLEHSNSLDDPIVQEVIASLRREIVKLEEEKPARVNEAIKKEHEE